MRFFTKLPTLEESRIPIRLNPRDLIFRIKRVIIQGLCRAKITYFTLFSVK